MCLINIGREMKLWMKLLSFIKICKLEIYFSIHDICYMNTDSVIAYYTWRDPHMMALGGLGYQQHFRFAPKQNKFIPTMMKTPHGV